MFDKFTEFAKEKLFLNSSIYINSNKELTIENCSRIEEYSDVFFSLVSGGLTVHIWGCGLRAFDFKTGGLIIKGRISQIELLERSRK